MSAVKKSTVKKSPVKKSTAKKKTKATSPAKGVRKASAAKKSPVKQSTNSTNVTNTKSTMTEMDTATRISDRGEPQRSDTVVASPARKSPERASATQQLARQAAKFGLDRKAHDVRILKLKDLSSVCDYFVILSGDADVHVRAIADHIEDSLAKVGHWPTYREGKREGNWIVLDYIDVVVHVFMDGTRRHYQLEKLWGDAPLEVVTDD